jgi:hypothetical protein
LKDLPKQIALAEERTIWHPPVDDVIIYTHFYTEEDHGSPQGWKPVLEFHVPEEADTCLRKLAERNDQGELEVLSLTKLLRGV